MLFSDELPQFFRYRYHHLMAIHLPRQTLNWRILVDHFVLKQPPAERDAAVVILMVAVPNMPGPMKRFTPLLHVKMLNASGALSLMVTVTTALEFRAFTSRAFFVTEI